MSKKEKVVFVCCECGYESAKWNGICPSCGQGNTMTEEVKIISKKSASGNKSISRPSDKPTSMKNIDITGEVRYSTGLKELDRVFGGGIVKGSFVLLGGAPGIGKSTLLLQICNYMDRKLKILYISGEESKKQIKLRASRLGIDNPELLVMTENDMENVINEIMSCSADIVIVDSIQTMNSAESTSLPGSVAQVKECANILLKLSKSLEIPILTVGHVNKDGAIAGPKVLEHIVDAVLYFEGEKNTQYRIIRAAKNRYGSTNEIGVFQMVGNGLEEVINPSLMLLSGRPQGVSGTCVTCVMEGSRPILTEVQGLVTVTGFGNPRRMSAGFDYNRMTLILAVLEKRAGYFFSNSDVYVNIVGGVKLDEPSSDLAVAVSLISSLKDVPVDDYAVVFGEIGLTGEIRTAQNVSLRITEAARLGFKHCIIPHCNLKALGDLSKYNIKITGVKTIREAFDSASIK